MLLHQMIAAGVAGYHVSGNFRVRDGLCEERKWLGADIGEEWLVTYDIEHWPDDGWELKEPSDG